MISNGFSKKEMSFENIRGFLFNGRRVLWIVWGVWLFLNLGLLVVANGKLAFGDRVDTIYPFYHKGQETCLWAYDFTEFIGYTFLLSILVGGLYFLLNSGRGKICKRLKFVLKVYIVYCFGLSIVSFVDDSCLLDFSLGLFKVINIMLITNYFAEDFWKVVIPN